ncbi:MAG: aminomethyl transferase family protein [Chloroflexi bacterium]|nr:aminomethyl transferase family protein [Chloroflexota bacterium]
MNGRSPLYDLHRQSGATFTHVGDGQVPDSFGDPATEYQALREGVALLDRSLTGRFRVTGRDALDLLNRLSTNKVDVLPPGTGAGTILTTNKGRVIDLLHLFSRPDHLLMVTSPQTRSRVAEWIDLYTFLEEVTLQDVTEATCTATLLGPQAMAVVETLTGVRVGAWQPYTSASVVVDGVEAALLRSDPLGRPAYDLVVPAEQGEALWTALASAGATPVGERAYNGARVEAGIPRHGWELSEEVNPWEVNLQGYIHFEKGCYVGQEVILRLDTYKKVQRRLVALAFGQGPVPERAVLQREGQEVGVVTSAAEHPVTGAWIGLGLVRVASASSGTELQVVGEGSETMGTARVTELAPSATVPA